MTTLHVKFKRREYMIDTYLHYIYLNVSLMNPDIKMISIPNIPKVTREINILVFP